VFHIVFPAEYEGRVLGDAGGSFPDHPGYDELYYQVNHGNGERERIALGREMEERREGIIWSKTVCSIYKQQLDCSP